MSLVLDVENQGGRWRHLWLDHTEPEAEGKAGMEL